MMDTSFPCMNYYVVLKYLCYLRSNFVARLLLKESASCFGVFHGFQYDVYFFVAVLVMFHHGILSIPHRIFRVTN